MKNDKFTTLRKLSKKEAFEFWQKHDAKWANDKAETYNYYETENGDVIELGRRLPYIESTMYYNDEHEEPKLAFKNFESYNLKYHLQEFAPFTIEIRDLRHKYVAALKFLRDHVYRACYLSPDGWPEAFKDGDILLTQEEIDILNAEIEKNKEDYKKRLRTYWKKYQDKVTTYGYWANR